MAESIRDLDRLLAGSTRFSRDEGWPPLSDRVQTLVEEEVAARRRDLQKTILILFRWMAEDTGVVRPDHLDAADEEAVVRDAGLPARLRGVVSQGVIRGLLRGPEAFHTDVIDHVKSVVGMRSSKLPPWDDNEIVERFRRRVQPYKRGPCASLGVLLHMSAEPEWRWASVFASHAIRGYRRYLDAAQGTPASPTTASEGAMADAANNLAIAHHDSARDAERTADAAEGLEQALLDVSAFDRLFDVYLADPDPAAASEPPLPDDLRRRVREGGVGALLPDEAAELLVRPTWLADLWDALADLPPYWAALRERRAAARAGDATLDLAGRIRREVEQMLAFAPSTPNARLAKWAADRVRGAGRSDSAGRAEFLKATAEVIRMVRAADAAREAAAGSATGGRTTLAEAARAVSLDTIANQASVAAVDLAHASRTLDAEFPEMGEVFLLAYYGGQTAADVAALVGRPVAEVEEQLEDAGDWARVQSPAPASHS